eukprot:357614-Amphidinium_carterae.1
MRAAAPSPTSTRLLVYMRSSCSAWRSGVSNPDTVHTEGMLADPSAEENLFVVCTSISASCKLFATLDHPWRRQVVSSTTVPCAEAWRSSSAPESKVVNFARATVPTVGRIRLLPPPLPFPLASPAFLVAP